MDLAWVGIIADSNPALAAVIDASGMAHGAGMKSYLIMMAVRLLEMRRLLKSTGSIYLHCDSTASHYLKMVMDAVFKPGNFRNEVTWRRTNAKGLAFKGYPNNADFLLYYSKAEGFTWNRPFRSHDPTYVKKFYRHVEPETGRHYQLGDLANPNMDRPNLTYEFLGVTRVWRWTRERMQKAYEQGLVVQQRPGAVPRLKRYLDEMKGNPVDAIWDDIKPVQAHSKERLGYPTQKPLVLMERIVAASSNEGDIVLDPFCGCATAPVAADLLNRQWIGIDLSSRAVDLVKMRLDGLLGSLYRPDLVTHRTDVPQRTDVGKLPHYRTHRHSLYGQQEGFCNGCEEHFRLRNLTVDHVVPKSRGGTDDPDNLQLLCGACNSMKGTKEQAAFLATMAALGVVISRQRTRA